jgi:hypothetical protein
MSAGAAAGAAAAAIAEAIKASGVLVRVTPEDFLAVAGRQTEPLIVTAIAGIFTTKYQYLSSYKGLGFFTESLEPLDLPRGSEVIQAKKIWMPG